MARKLRLIAQLWRARTREDPAPPARGLGEPPSADAAGDAELDSLRGELVRELDRIAAGAGPAPRAPLR
jgi:hypothetical protein